MIRSFLAAVPPLKTAGRGLSTVIRASDAPAASTVVYDASEVAATIPGFEFTSAWCEDEVKDTPYAKNVPDEPVNVWGMPSVDALHTDLERIQAIRAEAEPSVQPVTPFAPINVAAIHADFAKVQSLCEEPLAPDPPPRNAWEISSLSALHADIELLQTLRAETDFPASTNPFAPRSISALHKDLAAIQDMQAAELDAVPEIADQIHACAPPAFAPVSISRIHEDFVRVQALVEEEAKPTN